MANYVNSKVVINRSAIKQLTMNAIRALEITGDEVLGQIIEKQVVPMDVGTLQESGYVNTDDSSKGSVKITFNTPYARRLYFHPEYNFRKDNNPNAKGKWMEDWAENGKYADEVKEIYAYHLKRLGGL